MSIKKFAGIVEGDIFTIFVVDSEFQGENGEAGERIIAGLNSQPTFVEIPSDLNVSLGWKWDGTNFVEG